MGISINLFNLRIRGIAQSGSAPALGAGCREFESLYPDQIKQFAWMVKLVDTRDLKSLGRIGCAGSSPAPGTIVDRWCKD